MAGIFSVADSVFFVGGTGTKAGLSDAGGCTKEFFDNNGGDGSFALSTIMGTNGAAKVGETACNYDHEGAAEGNRKINKNDAGEFADAAVGMVAYISGTNITTGRYKITGIDSANGNYVLVSGITATGDNSDTIINIGGALNTLSRAIADGILDATSFNVHVYDNKAETLSAGIDVAVEGSTTAGTHLYVKGFNTIPGDMDYGGSYYQSPLSAENDGVDTSKCVEIDGDEGDYHLLDLTGMDCVHFHNFYFHNIKTDTSKVLGNSGYHIEFNNCKFNTAQWAIKGTDSGMVVGCWFGTGFGDDTLFPDDTFRITGSFVNAAAGKAGIGSGDEGSAVIGNIFVGGAYGINLGSTSMLCVGNTFYNQTTACIRVYSYGDLAEFNNIFMPADENDYAVLAERPGSSDGVVLYSDFSLAYNVAGNSCTNPWWDDWAGRDLQGANSLKNVDPQFVDAANGDFRPRSPDAIRKGKPDIHGNAACMGAVLEPADKVIRAAVANLGRLRTIR